MGSQPKGISASRAAAVLGLSEWQTPLEVFQRIMEEREPGWNAAHGYAAPEEPESAAMRWGTAFEGAVIELAEVARGMKIIHREQEYARGIKKGKGEKYLTCHIDGRYDNNSGNYHSCDLHEGKTTSAFSFREKWGAPGTDHVPQEYYCQTQHQMICTGAEKVIVSALVFPEAPEAWEKMGWYAGHDGKKWLLQNDGMEIGAEPESWAHTLAEMGFFHQYTVQARPSLQAEMIERYRSFWENHVVPGIPPEPENYDDVKRLFPEPKKTLIVSDAVERMLSEYAQINKEAKEQEKRREEIKVKVLAWAREQTDGVIDDESTEALILRDGKGDKVGSFAKNKNGALVFRA
jgi:predicted phage-related endonuclease